MASQAARQRKGVVGAPRSGEALVQIANAITEDAASLLLNGSGGGGGGTPLSSGNNMINSINNNNNGGVGSLRHSNHHQQQQQQQHVIVATVKRNKYGTSPFDENWLNLDCCGLFCAAITYMLHMYGVYATCVILIPPWMSTVDELGVRTITLMGHVNRLAFTTIALLAVYAHWKAMTTDPGAVPPDAVPLTEQQIGNNRVNNIDSDNMNGDSNNNNIMTMGGDGQQQQQYQTSSLMQDDPLLDVGSPPLTQKLPPAPTTRQGKRLCRRCNTFKPKRAHHCSICKRCIIKMDHHCPWVNNCVGIGNHKYFLLFVFYTCLSCIYSISLIFIRFFDCMGRHGHVRTHHLTCLDRPTQLVSILGLFVEAILFGLFTSCMMIDQAGVVTTKMTHIDRLKGGDDGGSSLEGVIEVFGLHSQKLEKSGSAFRPDWLSPFHRICFPSSVQDEIMGFCRPCSGGVGPTSGRGTNGSGDFGGETELLMMNRTVADIV